MGCREIEIHKKLKISGLYNKKIQFEKLELFRKLVDRRSG